MEDLIQYSGIRDDFQQWLAGGRGALTIEKDGEAHTVLTEIEKNPDVYYLYRTVMWREDGISWDIPLTFCGVYDTENQALYLTEDMPGILTRGQAPLVAGAGSSTVEEIRGGINRRVEEIIANDRNNLSVREITSAMTLRDLQYYQEYGAKQDAVRQFFGGVAPDGQFHSDYAMDRLSEPAFLAYIQDPEGFVRTEAEEYIKTNQERFLLEFLKNDALLAAYQDLTADAGNPIHRMKAITDAVKASGAKTVTVTVEKAGQELTFKTRADSLMGPQNYYSTYYIPASDRREFEKLFGRHADYTAEDVARITYGRNTIYEAAPVQVEEPVEEIGIGGMQFG